MVKKKFLIAVKIQHEALFEVMAEDMEDAEDKLKRKQRHYTL